MISGQGAAARPRLARRVARAGRQASAQLARLGVEVALGSLPWPSALADARANGLAIWDELRLTCAAERAGLFVSGPEVPGHGPADKFFCEAPGHSHYDARYFRGVVAPDVANDTLRQLLAAFADLCHAHALPFFLVHGTLLGWTWGRRIMPWDDDIDLSVSMDVLVELRALQPRAQHSRWLLEVNPHFRDRRTRNSTIRDTLEPNKIDARVIDRSSGLFLDVTGVASIASGLLASKCPHIYRRDEIYPLRRESFEGVEVFVPHHVDRLLHREYGRQCTIREHHRGYHWVPEEGRWRPDGDNWHRRGGSAGGESSM